jgi:hypothetical protein
MLGDSVLYGTALREHGIKAWRDQTPAAYLQGLSGSPPVLNLSDEGLYPEDLLALAGAARGLKLKAAVVELNYRMLDHEAGEPAKALTRPYLQAYLPPEFQGLSTAAASSLGMDSVSAWVEGNWRLLRYAEAWGEMSLPGGTKRLLSDWVAGHFPSQDGVDADVLLDMKIRPYYDAPAAGPQHRGLQALNALALRLSKLGVPVLVFLTPQNLERVADFLDPAALKQNRATLARCFQRPGIRYRDWSAERPGGTFLDHCHLDAAGNRALALRIAAELKP